MELRTFILPSLKVPNGLTKIYQGAKTIAIIATAENASGGVGNKELTLLMYQMKNDLAKSLYFLRSYVYRTICDTSSYSGMRISTAESLIEKIQHAIDHVGNDHCEDYDPPDDFESGLKPVEKKD